MISQIVTTFGLVLDITGAGILFFFASPQPDLEGGVAMGLEDNNVLADGKTVAQHNDEVRMQKEQYINISKSALALIILASFFKLLGLGLST